MITCLLNLTLPCTCVVLCCLSCTCFFFINVLMTQDLQQLNNQCNDKVWHGHIRSIFGMFKLHQSFSNQLYNSAATSLFYYSKFRSYVQTKAMSQWYTKLEFPLESYCPENNCTVWCVINKHCLLDGRHSKYVNTQQPHIFGVKNA